MDGRKDQEAAREALRAEVLKKSQKPDLWDMSWPALCEWAHRHANTCRCSEHAENAFRLGQMLATVSVLKEQLEVVLGTEAVRKLFEERGSR